uniref:Uncharacterized protein n=1 Tax=Kalanchoe fedtschenkoi TaxID=63787 RepID=A0A7N0TGB9_KALFE
MNLSKPKSSNHLPPPPSSSRFAVCHRHPGEPVTGFCAACLSERLAVLDPAGVKSVVETGQSSKSGCGGGVPELSRSKSCSQKRGGFVGVSLGSVEPRRKSCDVRGRSSLSSLFGIDDADGDVGMGKGGAFVDERACGVVLGKEEEVGVGEIRASDEQGDGSEEWRTMKEHIDLECRSSKRVSKGKDLKNIAGSIWVAAASGLSKKLQKWRQKQKMRMPRDGNVDGGVGVEVATMNLRQWRERETQSEVGDYGFGRRSCDTDPRFSIDACRASVDCPCPPRFSLDEQPRASWDGYLIGRLSAHRPNQMLAVVEDDDHVEDLINVSRNEIDKSPGGSEQTRDYYGDASSRRRRSFDRSGSRRASSVEIEELRAISNARVSPATVELFHGAKVLLTKNYDAKMPSLSPIRTDRAVRVESSDSASNGASSIAEEGCDNSKSHVTRLATGWRKAWTNWGMSQKQDEEEPKIFDKITASSTHPSSSSSGSVSGSFMKSSTEAKGSGNLRQLAMERSRNSRYAPSPNSHENGLLRFYLTPLRGSRGGGKCSKSRLKSSQDIARNVLRLS